MRYLLDTCVVSELTKVKPSPHVVEWVDRQSETNLYLSVITLGELRKGIHRLPSSEKRKRLQLWLESDLMQRFAGRWLDITPEVADRWGQLAAEQEKNGKVLPVLDGLIAASAWVNGMTVVTRNVNHIESVKVAVFNPWE